MTIISEQSSNPLKTSLDVGIDSISSNQVVTFNQYNKYVMPSDGFIFWIKSQNPSIQFKGSLHFISDKIQDEDETFTINKIIFTSEKEITPLNNLNPQSLWVAQIVDPSGALMRASFSSRGSFYEKAGVWHYSGDAIYPSLQSQLIDSIEDLPDGPLISNSLPIWLSLNQFADVYPSYLLPDNLTPPYIAVNIDPERTEALAAFPKIINKGSSTAPNTYKFESSQLMQDSVELVLYGFNNNQVIQYLNYLMDYSLNTDVFGFCSSPVIQDDKKTQVELGIIAQKKTIKIKVSYYQSSVDAIIRKLILSASSSLDIN